MSLVESVYRLTAGFPRDENYELRAQLRCAAVSIPSNIAEGQARASTKEFLNHLSMALGSLAEIETQIEISIRLKYLLPTETVDVISEIQKLGKQLHALRSSLEARK